MHLVFLFVFMAPCSLTVYYNYPNFRVSVKGNNLLDVQYWVSDGYYAGHNVLPTFWPV